MPAKWIHIYSGICDCIRWHYRCLHRPTSLCFLFISVPTVINPLPPPNFFPLSLFLAPFFNASRAWVVRLQRPPLCVGGQSTEHPPEEVGTSPCWHLTSEVPRKKENQPILTDGILSSAATSMEHPLRCVPSHTPTRRCIIHIQHSKDSCSASEALQGKGARWGASMMANLHQDSTKQHLGRRELHWLELLEREHPFVAVTGGVACKFDFACCGARNGLGGKARAPLVILTCVGLDRESTAADPAV